MEMVGMLSSLQDFCLCSLTGAGAPTKISFISVQVELLHQLVDLVKDQMGRLGADHEVGPPGGVLGAEGARSCRRSSVSTMGITRPCLPHSS